MTADEMIGCPYCTDGRVVEVHLAGDGLPGVETRLRRETRTCRACGGDGEIPRSEIDPEDHE